MHQTPWIQQARDYQVGFQPSMSPTPPASVPLCSSHHSSNLSRSYTHSRSRRCTYQSGGACPTQGSSNAQIEASEERGEEMERKTTWPHTMLACSPASAGTYAQPRQLLQSGQSSIITTPSLGDANTFISLAIQAMLGMLKALHCGSYINPPWHCTRSLCFIHSSCLQHLQCLLMQVLSRDAVGGGHWIPIWPGVHMHPVHNPHFSMAELLLKNKEALALTHLDTNSS